MIEAKDVGSTDRFNLREPSRQTLLRVRSLRSPGRSRLWPRPLASA